MVFSVFSNGTEWSLDFGPDLVTLTVKDLFQEMTISSQEFPLAAWSLLLSHRQEILNNQLVRFPITPNQEGTKEIRDELLSSVGALDMDTRRYQLSDPGYVEFFWENDQLNVDAFFRPGVDTFFSS